MAKGKTGFAIFVACVCSMAGDPEARGGVPGVQACCTQNGNNCIDVPGITCIQQGGVRLGEGSTCAANGAACPVPAVGTWGLVVLVLVLLNAGSLVLSNRAVRIGLCRATAIGDQDV